MSYKTERTAKATQYNKEKFISDTADKYINSSERKETKLSMTQMIDKSFREGAKLSLGKSRDMVIEKAGVQFKEMAVE